MIETDIALFKKALQATGIPFKVEYLTDGAVIFNVPCHMNTVHFRFCNGGSVHVVSSLGTVHAHKEHCVLTFLNQLMIKCPYLQLTLQDSEIIGNFTFAIPFGTEGKKRSYFNVHIAMLMSLFSWATHETFALRKNADLFNGKESQKEEAK